MDKNIPTIDIKVKNGDENITVTLYQWLTESEEEESQKILYKDFILEQEVSMKEKGAQEDGTQKMQLSYSKLIEKDTFILKSLLKSPSYEEFSMLNPKVRAEVKLKVKEIVEGNEKK
jgi:hypothetical protein